MTESIRFVKAQFVKSCYHSRDFPQDNGWEVIFLGRSNVGKSSLINALCNRTGLAKTSRTPGRTQCFNVFSLSDSARFIDAPGYGFAKVRQAMMKDWQMVLNDYLVTRQCLRQVILIMDSRHPLQKQDIVWLESVMDEGLPCSIVLSKMDKISKNQQKKQIQLVTNFLKTEGVELSCWGVSAKNRINIDSFRTYLESLS
jgi:GTP-binding protein